MQRRQITLEDGRYLIFYTFEDETGTASNSSASAAEAAVDESAHAPGREPSAEPQATEEKRV